MILVAEIEQGATLEDDGDMIRAAFMLASTALGDGTNLGDIGYALFHYIEKDYPEIYKEMRQKHGW